MPKKKAARKRKASARKKPAKAKKRAAKAAPKRSAGKVVLTAREEEVLRLMSLGCSVREVADVLGLAPSTADNHKSRLMAKLGTDKTVLATRLAIQMGYSSMRDKLSLAEKRRCGRKQDGWN